MHFKETLKLEEVNRTNKLVKKDTSIILAIYAVLCNISVSHFNIYEVMISISYGPLWKLKIQIGKKIIFQATSHSFSIAAFPWNSISNSTHFLTAIHHMSIKEYTHEIPGMNPGF